MLLLVDRREAELRSTLCDDLDIEGSRSRSAHAGTNTGEDDLVDVLDLDEGGLFADEEDVFFKQEEVALNSFEIGFDAGVAIAGLEGAGADDLFAGEGTEDGGNDFVGGVFVALFEFIVLGNIFSAKGLEERR